MSAHEVSSDGLLARIKADLAPSLAAPGRAGRVWIATLLAVVVAGACAYAWQLARGLQVTAMREYVSWGVYMTNFVFFIGVSHAGTLISAILRVTNADWRRPITRMAEAITVFALLVGAPMVIIDMGRPDRILYVVTHGRLNSPILWDVLSIGTYITGSVLYLYVAMLPDLALLVEPGTKQSLRQRIYRALSLGYRGTQEQRRLLEKALATMAVIIIPVAVSVHTVVSWIFGMTLRPGWHSTIFGPYFVIGAIFSGTAAIITAMAIFRRAYRLEAYLTFRQFKNLSTLLLALNLLYIYFTLSEYLTTWYGSAETDKRLIDLLMGSGPYGLTFWAMALFGLFVPAVLLGLPNRGSIARIVVAAVLINVAMWIKRYLIIVPTLMTPYIPAEAGGVTPHYHPTWVEWTVTAGGFAFFLLMFTLFAKLFPILSIWETVEGVEEIGAQRVGVDLPSAIAPRLAPAAALMLALLVMGTVARSDDAAPRAQLTLSTSVEDGKKMIVATVLAGGKPRAGAKIVFEAPRTFGPLVLGEDTTLDDGTAAVQFPADLPAGAEGKLAVTARIKEPADLATVRAETIFDGALKFAPKSQSVPRALWAPRAPVPLVAAIAALLGAVWLTFARVVFQLIRIRKSTPAS